MRAKYETRCPRCHERIYPGAEIRKQAGEPAQHKDCDRKTESGYAWEERFMDEDYRRELLGMNDGPDW